MNKFLSFIADRIYTFLLISFFVVILHKKTNCAKSVFSCREDRSGSIRHPDGKPQKSYSEKI